VETAALVVAALAAVVTGWGTLKLWRIDPSAYGKKPLSPHPADVLRAGRDQQSAGAFADYLRETKTATGFVFAGVLLQIVAAFLGLLASR
jgi:hypothetical protein